VPSTDERRPVAKTKKAAQNAAQSRESQTAEAGECLTAKKRAFVAEYVKNGMNGAKAAAAAGYSKKGAKESAYRLMAEPAVKAAVEAALRAIEDAGIATRAMVLRELTMIGLFDLRRAFNPNGTLLTPAEMPEEVGRVLAGIETEEIFEGSGQDRTWSGYSKKIKTCDKVKALELLGKHHKLFTDKILIDASESLGEALRKARARIKRPKKESTEAAA
jgi:phage terminase small subunit